MNKCLHSKHRTPEFRWWNIYNSCMPRGFIIQLKALNMLAEKCVDCGEDITNLELLK